MPTPSSAAPLLTLARPDDWHLHLRDGAGDGRASLAATAARLRASNRHAKPPAAGDDDGAARAPTASASSRALPAGSPLRAADDALPHGQHEPGGNRGGEGVRASSTRSSTTRRARRPIRTPASPRSQRVYPALAAMEKHGVVLSVHGEVTDADVDIFDRERVFVERSLAAIVRDFPGAQDRARAHHDRARPRRSSPPRRPRVAATITPQHLLYSRNALFAGGVRPHLYCLPILKRERHRQALVAAATVAATRSSSSAPIPRRTRAHTKENACGCAGCYSAPVALALYAEAFEAAGALDRLEGFASHFGADFYGLPRNGDKVTLAREPWTVPAEYPFGDASRSCRCAPARRVLARARGRLTSRRAEPRRRGAILASPKPARPSPPGQPGGGKSGLRRAGCRVTPGRNKSPLARMTKARNRATETSRRGSHRGG